MGMNYSEQELARDIDRVNQIPIITTLLDVICQTTGMGFAAIARVTESRWITCTVRDDIQFGLVTGSELRLETTICNEIRDSFRPVIIDHVQESKLFSNHPTPLMYGFQSYISYPIILKTGEFFGTLCAVDPKPAVLENPKIKGMFAAFTDLIAFHLQQIELLEQGDQAVRNLSLQLTSALDENKQYRHTLRQPLRKLSVLSNCLVKAIKSKELEKAEKFALNISSGAEKFSNLIESLSDFSGHVQTTSVQKTDLRYVVRVVIDRLSARLDEKGAKVHLGGLPILPCVSIQLEQLFYHLFENAIMYSKKWVPLHISISSRDYSHTEVSEHHLPDKRYIQITITDNGVGIDPLQLEKISDMLSLFPSKTFYEGAGSGLSICRKIMHNHAGQIKIESDLNIGTTVLVILPIN